MRLFSLLFAFVSANLVNEKVIRVFDATTQLLKSSASVQIRNDGNVAVSTIQLSADAFNADKLIFLDAKVDDKKLKVDGDYKATLSSPLEPGQTITLEIEEIYHGSVKPFPTEIKQADKQLVLVEVNLYYTSPYKTLISNARINIGTKKTESVSKTGKLEGSAVKLEEKKDFEGGSSQKSRVHFENNSPSSSPSDLSVWVKHTGATLKGSFSRFDFQRQDTGAFITEWKMILPLEAQDVYYRDLIGNISTSALRQDYRAGETVLELTPRFPMFGGWRNHYTIGYNVPSATYLSSDASKYQLKVPATPELYNEFIIENYFLKVILPEGVADVSFKTNIALERKPDESRYTFLDTTGRTVVVFEGKDVTYQHAAKIAVTYNWNSILIFKEPLLAISGWAVFFFVLLFFARLDYSISAPVSADKKKN
ncbi:Oidioi.mRNA.OKI2018_I69.XSR.g14188.t1.cds [Oikopleura dioica]|uniref:Dolichyl-diphosphooligosaccharide--protein glycosyltransferase subunit 1 n=1 Tax=Oikopleura dioica TaxID=34765 RepID=A0ABN7S922_OIKDI|nr:Oidioi.mRNA.OKI2018_I69.XSR.g14188.t1.cds [Oikopleura dioica]